MALGDVCVHSAVPVKTKIGAGIVDGERETVEAAVPEEEFDSLLFLPVGSEDRAAQQRAGRQVIRPTVMWETGPELSREDKLDIMAAEIPGHATAVRYEFDGDIQPLGRPGEVPRGFQAELLRV